MNTATGLSLSGLALAVLVLAANLRRWWKGNRDPKDLAHFGQGFALGALATACAGGLLGWLAGCAPGIANSGGQKGVSGLTGASPSSPIARGSIGSLTEEGAVVVAIFAVAVVWSWRTAKKDEKKRLGGGLFCGSTLCATAGIAGMLTWLPELVNTIGVQGRTLAESQGWL
ncbi:hypothetical protein [Streptomyces sp. NPDC013171]|uniref:hypothetical protein n=1 Tax=Streptomyces sp. NPDC013171 TaxID=3364863 RepID=UPI003676215D